MTHFYAKNNQFWLDDQPLLLQAGEFHYFRTPTDQWPHRLGLLKNAGFNSVAAYMPWLWHQPEAGTSDFDGHSHPMRNLAGFLDLAVDMGFWIIARPGPYKKAETINEGIPPRVIEKKPQAAFVNQAGKVQNIASYLHPDFLACVRNWYRAIFAVLTPRQITRDGKIILVQLDNEMGMPHWVRNMQDTNPDTLARFASYLQNRYGARLPARYPTSHLTDFLHEGMTYLTEPHATYIVEDYRRFYRTYLRDYASFLWTEAQENGLEVPPVINIHGFMNGGKTFPIGLSQLVEVMEMDGMISATDVYPIFIGEGNFHQLLMLNEMTKALQNPHKALYSIEFQAGGNSDFGAGQTSLYDLHSRLCISTGMRAINHYLFFDGENDPILSPVKRHDWGHPVRKDGTLRKHYFRYPKLSSVLNAYGPDLIRSQPQTVTTVGFILDYFMTELNNPFTQETTNILTHQREVILFDLIAKGLALTHRPFDAIDLSRCHLDVRQIPLVWVMMERQCPAEIQQKLVEYVERGGNLILIGRMCIKDFNHEPTTILKDALHIHQIHGDMPFVSNSIRAFTHHDIPVSFLETYAGEFEEVIATCENGEVVGFTKKLGKGKVLCFGAAMAANTLDDLDIVHQIALKMDCLPQFNLSDWADVRLSYGTKGSFLFINNYQDDPVKTTIERGQDILFGGNAVQIPARMGLILPLEWALNEDVKIHYVTSELVEIYENDSTLTLRTAQDELIAEMTLLHYTCDQAVTLERLGEAQRVFLHSKTGVIVLQKRTPTPF